MHFGWEGTICVSGLRRRQTVVHQLPAEQAIPPCYQLTAPGWWSLRKDHRITWTLLYFLALKWIVLDPYTRSWGHKLMRGAPCVHCRLRGGACPHHTRPCDSAPSQQKGCHGIILPPGCWVLLLGNDAMFRLTCQPLLLAGWELRNGISYSEGLRTARIGGNSSYWSYVTIVTFYMDKLYVGRKKKTDVSIFMRF